MITAAILPCSAYGHLAAVIVETDGDALRLLARHRIEVGRLVPRAVPRQQRGPGGDVRTMDLERALSPEDAQALAAGTVALLAIHGVQRVLVEEPGARRNAVATRSAMMGQALAAAARAAGIEVAAVEQLGAGHLGFGGFGRHVEPAELVAIEGWPPGKGDTSDDERHAAALLLPREAKSDGVARAEKRDRQHDAERPGPPPADDRPGRMGTHATARGPAEALASVPGAGVDEGTEEREASSAHVAEPLPKIALRVAAVDPGTHWIHVTVAEGSARPLTLVANVPIEFGREIPSAKKGAKAGDTERSFEDADIDAAVEQLIDILQRYDVDEVIVERARHLALVAHLAGAKNEAELRRRIGWEQNRGTQLIRTQAIAGELRRAAKMAGYYVLESVAEPTWSARVAGRKREGVQGSVTERKAAAVRDPQRGFLNWPDIEGDARQHARDSGGMALYVVDTYHAPAPTTAPRAPRTRKADGSRAERKKATDTAYRAEKSAEKKSARAQLVAEGKCIGCPRRHRVGCPSYVQRLHGLPSAPKPVDDVLP